MKCSCGDRAVYSRRYSGQIFCENCFIEYFEKKVWETIRKKDMINVGDRICVALSGGKDSTVLLHVLKKIFPDDEISIQALAVDEGIEGYRNHGIENAKRVCGELSVSLRISYFEEKVDQTLDVMVTVGERNACTYCGVFRRRILNEEAISLGVEKIATGHNLDDEVQAIIMNYMVGDINRLRRLSGNTESHQLVKRIKPLSRIPEKEIMLYAILNKLDVSRDECPYAHDNVRSKVREFLNSLETRSPGIKFQIASGWEKLNLAYQKQGNALGNCSRCSQPAAQKICRACELSEEIKIKMRGS